MSSLTAMIQRREWKAVISRIKKKPWEASVQQLHLHEACRYNPPMSVISAFVRADSRFRTAADGNGESPIHTACYYGASEEVIKFLAHELVSATSRVSNQTPLDIAQATVWEHNVENQAHIIRLLQKETFPAFFDGLTDLPQKKAFEKWAHVSPYEKCYAFVFFIDIAGFKFLNDTGGQSIGDEAIRTYAFSIERECREFEANWACEMADVGLTGDVFRMGGDEFVVVVKLSADSDESSCKQVWKAICETLLPKLGSLKESRYHTFARVGCSAGWVSTSENAEDIRKKAEKLQNDLKAQLKTKRGEKPLLSDYRANGMSKMNICSELLEWDPFRNSAQSHQVLAQSVQSKVVQQEDPCQSVVAHSVQGMFSQHEQGPKESSVNDVFFHLQAPPTIKDTYNSIHVKTKHYAFLKAIEKHVNDPEQNAIYEAKWNTLRSCRMILTNGKLTTLRNALDNYNLRAIIWCAEGVDVNMNRDGNDVLSSIAQAKHFLIHPAVVVVMLMYSPERAAEELLSRGVHTVIWIRMDIYEHEPWILLSKLFLPICDAILAGKDLREALDYTMKDSLFFPNCPEQQQQNFGIKGVNVPQQANRNHGRVRGLHADLEGCEVCRTNTLELTERESFTHLEVRSSDLQSLESIRQLIYRKAINPRQMCTKCYIQLSLPYHQDEDDAGLDRARALAWETCRHFATMHSDLFPGGVFRVASVSDLETLCSSKHKLCTCVLLWIDLQNSECSDKWIENSKRMFREVGECRRLLVIFTSDIKCLQKLRLLKNEMGLRIGFIEKLPAPLPGTDISASSMHDCIAVIPTQKEGCSSGMPLLDVVLGDPANFELAFRQIVLFPIELNDCVDSPVREYAHSDFPPIVAVYHDEKDQSVKVRVCLSDVIFLMRLCGRILSGDRTAEKLSDSLDVKVRFDRAAFARVYEKTLLQLENMTPHQREKMKYCEGERLVHIEARAGTGKTFLALNISLAFLRKHEDKILLYASSSKALCFFFVKWLCQRPMLYEERELFLARLFLMYPGDAGEAKIVGIDYDEESRRLEQIEGIPLENGGKVVVDEAHHVFDAKQVKMHLVASKANEFIEDNSFEVLVLSDTSQSLSNADDRVYHRQDFFQAELTQVVRSCQRIVAGAMTYQLADRDLTHCAHDIEGPPLMTYIFDPEKHHQREIQLYADKIVDAIARLLDERFPKFDLHDRLAILVPNDTFRNNLKGILEHKLGKSLGYKVHLDTALESSQSLSLHDEKVSPLSPDIECCIVLDSVSNFHGQERLIVFGVDLDHRIEKRGDVGLIRSQIYTVITRAQMMFCLINKSIKGGWFEWLQNIEDSDGVGVEFSFREFVKFCNSAAADVVKQYESEDEVSNMVLMQKGPKKVSNLLERESESESESEIEPMPETETELGSKLEPEQEKDSRHHDASQSNEIKTIRNLSVWDTSQNDSMLAALSGLFVPLKKMIRDEVNFTSDDAGDNSRSLAGDDNLGLMNSRIGDFESGKDETEVAQNMSAVPKMPTSPSAILDSNTTAIHSLTNWDILTAEGDMALQPNDDWKMDDWKMKCIQTQSQLDRLKMEHDEKNHYWQSAYSQKQNELDELKMTLPFELLIARKEWDAFASKVDANAGEIPTGLLHRVCMHNPPLSVISSILMAREDLVDQRNRLGDIPLHTVCFYGAVLSVVKKLVTSYGESLKIKNYEGETPLDVAQGIAWTYCTHDQANTIDFLRRMTFPDDYDSVARTGLANGEAFRRWAHILPPRGRGCKNENVVATRVIVLFVDLSGFKSVNNFDETLQTGNRIIKEYGDRIRSFCRDFEAEFIMREQTIMIDVFRLNSGGGDEFVVVGKFASDNRNLSIESVWKDHFEALATNISNLEENGPNGEFFTFARIGCNAGEVVNKEQMNYLLDKAKALEKEIKNTIGLERNECISLSEARRKHGEKVNVKLCPLFQTPSASPLPT